VSEHETTATGRPVPVIVALPAVIDIHNSLDVRAQLAKASERDGCCALIADLSKTTFCDTSGACSLVLARMDAADQDVRLLAVVPSLEVRRVLTLAGLDSVLPVYASLTEALAVAYLTGPLERQRPNRHITPRSTGKRENC
jgi:anti-sigma B factor antagonist